MKTNDFESMLNQDAIFVEPFRVDSVNNLYNDPVVIFKIHLLYPSVVVAYNLCYSTLIGKIKRKTFRKKILVTCEGLREFNVKSKSELKDKVMISPNSVVFVKPSVREGVIPILLKQLINNFSIINKRMNESKEESKVLKVVYEELERTANAVYKYVGTSIKSRMGLPELADSIASLANKHIKAFIDSIYTKYNGKVINGDTNTLIIQFPGIKLEEAFNIAKTITSEESILKLSIESIMSPYLLISKDCFAGINTKSEFIHKGLDNTCPYINRLLIKVLEVILETRDFSVVKQLVGKKMLKLMNNKVSIAELVIRRANKFSESAHTEFTKLIQVPRLTRPEDSIQYVVIESNELKDIVVTPIEALSSNKKPNVIYYLYKLLVPSLNRLLRVFGIKAEKWIPSKEISLKEELEVKVKCKNCSIANESGCMNIYCSTYQELVKEKIKVN
jgi:DNA polymerase zeta